MISHWWLLAVALVTGGALSPLSAQKGPPPSTRPAGQPTTPAPTGQATQGKVFRPAAATGRPATAAQGAGPAPAAAPVTPQAARPAVATPAASVTAGLAMPPFTGGTPDAALAYAVRLGHMLDSTIVTLVDVFRNASGQPMGGASGPTALSQRERDRWSRCRNLYWDLTTYAAATGELKRALPADPALQHAVAALDTAMTASRAIAECDNVASMIAAPDRWTPWQEYYESSARKFYNDFYGQIRDVHQRDRDLVNALNAMVPPALRIPVPPGLPPNPPYAGAAPG